MIHGKGSAARKRSAAERVLDRLSAASAVMLAADSRRTTRILLGLDTALCVLATWIAFGLRIGVPYVPAAPFWITFGLSLSAWLICSFRLRFYRMVLRFAGGRAMIDLATICVLMILLMTAVILPLGIPSLPRTLAVLQPMTFVGLVGMSRLVIRFLLVDFTPRTSDDDEKRVLIYGAGRAGQQLALSIRHEPHLRILGFVDDDIRLQGHSVDGRPVYAPARFSKLLGQRMVDEVFIALPSATRARRRQIVEEVQAFEISVRVLPSVADIIAGTVTLSDLREVQIEDLLGRDPVPPDRDLMAMQITGKVVLVTGAGGSIGSELCRQIAALGPEKLVLVDHSEIALYAIDDELRLAAPEGCVLRPELGDVSRPNSIARILQRHKPHTVFHSAAYKHVPLVEANPLAGIWNNVFGTLACCQAAELAGVENFTLISTDKAVRPTNVMGASKRVCELILQARAAERSPTNFVMVRFGNVLGSSGSVIPRFRAQIARGGPVTVTHAEVTRFFMTIAEASQLVIQAGSMGEAGDVFVLDMGEPVKIIDLARTLIQLSHRTVRDSDDPDGEIEIIETGLRPGEKLYEELLIGSNPEITRHPRIIMAREEMLEWDLLENALSRLKAAIETGNSMNAIAILHELVPGFHEPVH